MIGAGRRIAVIKRSLPVFASLPYRMVYDGVSISAERPSNDRAAVVNGREIGINYRRIVVGVCCAGNLFGVLFLRWVYDRYGRRLRVFTGTECERNAAGQ